MSWHGSLELQEQSRILSESARPPGRFSRKKLANTTNLESCCHVDPIQAQVEKERLSKSSFFQRLTAIQAVVLVIVGPDDNAC